MVYTLLLFDVVEVVSLESEDSSSGTNVGDGGEEEVAVQGQGPLRTRESRKEKAPSQSTQSMQK
ncbi:hypothetical protein COLO4_33265 [Corchorus olitorius]|uniref:Uncharacterized protein n=1 Tax=Corchorus olitorius TaxID=93759 RepID=A0A1R3GVH4_9ROSI|nr:hypothetical protein COLO4_33265 [Corchorus olitorius]